MCSLRRILWLLCGGAVAACQCSPVDLPGSTVPDTCAVNPPLLEAQRTDILFVIDNSGSMSEEQEGVALELPAFIQELRAGAGITQDFRVAVINTSVYQHAFVPPDTFSLRHYGALDAGKLQPVPNADGTLSNERFIESTDPELVEKFSRLITSQGTEGSGQEAPFEAARLALCEDPPPPAEDPPLPRCRGNVPVSEGGTQGFLRDGARLLIVVVSDEDDCSEDDYPNVEAFIGADTARDWCREADEAGKLTSVQRYFDFFNGLLDGNGKRREVLWAAIAPVGVTSKEVAPIDDEGTLRNVDCPTSFQPGFRHSLMASLFDAGRNNLDSICSPSYRDSLVSIAQLAITGNSIEVMNAPDPDLLRVEITRGDGEVVHCTVSNGGIRYEPSTEESRARVIFQDACVRRPTDLSVNVQLICVG